MPAPFTLPETKLHLLEARESGRIHQLHVVAPPPHASRPERRHPAVYVLDPQWDFGGVGFILGNMAYDQSGPREFLMVGIGYPGPIDYERERHRDLSPVAVPFLDDGREQGGAARFLSFVADEVVPFAERELGADPARRVLIGSSLAGLFGLYALLERPGLFHGVVAVSPAVVWGDDWIRLRYERRAGMRIDAKLYMTAADDEWPDFLAATKRMNETLTRLPFPGLDYRWRLIEGERHCSTKGEGFTRGLRFVLAPWAPEPSRLP